MIVFTGHPDYDFVYRCEDRSASFGRYVGMRKGESFVEPLPLSEKTLDLLKDLKTQRITGNEINGDGVFHGTPKAHVFVEATKDSEDVFGKYPANLKKQKEVVLLEKDSPRLRQQFLRDLCGVIKKWSDSRMGLTYRSQIGFNEALNHDACDLIDRYFKNA